MNIAVCDAEDRGGPVQNQSVAVNVSHPIGIGLSSKQKKQRARELYLSGLTYAQIAGQLGFSRQRAQQLTRPHRGIIAIVNRRAAGKCENCGAEVQSLHLHHVRVGQTPENFNSPEMLLSLCVGCHKLADAYGSVEKTAELFEMRRVNPGRSDVSLAAIELGKRGAKARNKRLSAERRQEIARNAARERWRRVAQVSAQLTDETPT